MPKYSGKKRYTYRGRDKYSVEQSFINGTASAATTAAFAVVPPTDIQGMRKVKHLTVSLMPQASGTSSLVWCLFYLPAGMTAPGFSSTSGAPIVEPNQYVMNCGIYNSAAGPMRVTSPVSRNLNSGDQVILLVRALGAGESVAFSGLVRYAITLQ